MRLLVVDDHAELRAGVTALLASDHLQVTEAGSGVTVAVCIFTAARAGVLRPDENEMNESMVDESDGGQRIQNTEIAQDSGSCAPCAEFAVVG